ncbi:MAG: hypothetical protein V4850_08265 [Myxococcota bacterium]
MIPSPVEPSPSAEPSVWPRTVKLAIAAFLLGFLLFGPGLGQARFLLDAYHHGGL